MRSMWKGAIAFGLVSVPVKLYMATSQSEIELHQVHASDGGRIRYQRKCSACGELVEYADLAKSYESGDTQVVLTDSDMANLPLSSAKQISVEQFVRQDEIDMLMLSGRTYYVAPEEVGKRAYALLRDALAAPGLVGIVKVALRQRERLGMLRAAPSGTMVLELLNWPDEIRDAGDLNWGPVKLDSSEVRMARDLVKAMTGKFDPSEHKDGYREALSALVSAKISGGVTTVQPEPQGASSDLSAQLAASIKASRKGKGKK